MNEESLSVRRTARIFQLGEFSTATRELWLVAHGYGQLASYFLTHFEAIQSPQRVMVAPEGLSRFYLKGTHGRVGASWMTKEDREAEIEDQIAYLDQVLAHLEARQVGKEPLKLVLLGFSQGVATLWRWVNRGRPRPDWFILWAGDMPAETERIAGLTHMQLRGVVGSRDEFLTPEVRQNLERRLQKMGIHVPFQTFEGGHHLEPATLKTLAAEVAG